MEAEDLPSVELARQILPGPLLLALEHIFSEGIPDTMLVGGTAIAGFYAGHRRSDDLDLFARTEAAHRAAILATRRLDRLGTRFNDEYRSASYYHVGCVLKEQRFTVDVVLDPALFEVGSWHDVEPGIHVASLQTLIMTKAATLVSRCGEKDLYDLIWILEDREVTLETLLELGAAVDGGVNAEAVLISLTGSELTEGACNFGITPDQTPRRIFREVNAFRGQLEKALLQLLDGQPVPPLGKTVRKLRRLAARKASRSSGK